MGMQKRLSLRFPKKFLWGAATSAHQVEGGTHNQWSVWERDFIISSLENIGVVSRIHTSEPGEKLRFRGQQVRTFYVTDGSIKIVKLK